jgi:hypothetical protein
MNPQISQMNADKNLRKNLRKSPSSADEKGGVYGG